MEIIQTSAKANTMQLADGSTIYHYYPHLPTAITTFDSCKELSLWRSYYQPFSCAIVNFEQNECILIRDHLGIEPLYYCYQPDRKLIFGQSIPDVLKHLSSTPPLLTSQINMLFSAHKYYSDETIYQGIYRVEPGYLMLFKSDGSIIKRPFWRLDPAAPLLFYKDERDYHDHFSQLLNEAILNATENQTNIAAEFSAGLDSSTIYCAAAKLNIRPTLYMHVAKPNTLSANIYNDYHENAFTQHYQLNDIRRIDAEDFDALQVFNEYADWFAGPAPYLFPMFANNVHRAVAAGKHPILLSGFGGDQCVSGQLPINFFLPELLHQREFRQAWHELKDTSGIKKCLHYAKYLHPMLYAQSVKMKVLKQYFKNAFRSKSAYQSTLLHPYEYIYYSSVREVECSLLQGFHSHEVRMRVEYSSLVSKKMGFEYRYPLLYPKLLEFILSVPTMQKRRDGNGRYLIRQYLSANLPDAIFNTYRKKAGLSIVPSTFDSFQQKFAQGCYQQEFSALPYANLIKHKHAPIELRNCIKGFMLKHRNLN